MSCCVQVVNVLAILRECAHFFLVFTAPLCDIYCFFSSAFIDVGVINMDGPRISETGVHMYNGVGVSLC